LISIDKSAERDERAAPALLLTKLHPPAARNQTVARDRLLEHLQPAPGVRLIVVAAPAGGGKTTLLGTWRESEAERRSVAWVSCDEGDNDPVVLWSHVLESLRRVCPSLDTPRPPELVGAGRIVDAVLPDLVNGLTEQGETALILDDFHRLQSGPSRDSVAWLVEHSPESFQLVISTRSEPALPPGALRARGELLELRARDMGFSAAEASLLLNDRLELGLEDDDIDELVQRTEGWPAGLYLAALSLRGVEDRRAFVNRFGGSSRHVVDFLVGEVLDGYDPALQTLMVRCSVLERLCGPLCDATLELEGSDEQLRDLARTNLFLVPLDDHGHWYRFHHLFRQLLRVELEHREPGLAPTLLGRAYAWHRDNGSIDEAIDHALDAGAFAEAGELISTRWAEYGNVCRQATVLAWLERFPSEYLESSPVLLTVKAWILSLSAMREEALEAIAGVERLDGLDQGPLPDGSSSVEASIATLRATLPWGDVGSGYANAVRAAELEAAESPYWPMVCWALGMGHFFRGEPIEADPWFAEAARLGPSAGMWLVTGSALAYQSVIAGGQGDLEEQRRLAEEATELATERGIEEIDGEVPLALAASYVAHGELDEARPLLARGVEVLRAFGQPIDLAYALISQARVLLELGDFDTASAAIAEARTTVDSCPDPGILEDWLTALETPPRTRAGRRGDELSKRELVVLRALTGPLSERDIARELYLSHNTVHSHARSIYRKLGVTSRADAVGQARELGLL
jgi:LuxR family transcriptional regulator, maltose regulon positive regulatory protein